MITGEFCESCFRFNAGYGQVVPCSICGGDTCNYCSNMQLCKGCFRMHIIGTLPYDPYYEKDSDIISWIPKTSL